MSFKESDSLASDEPLLAKVTWKVDSLLETAAEDAVFDPDVVASSIEEPHARVVSVLNGLCQRSLLEMIIRRQCECGTFNARPRQRCSACQRSLNGAGERETYEFSARAKREVGAAKAAAKSMEPGKPTVDRVLQFVGGDRGGTQRQQLQVHKEYKLITDAIARGCYGKSGRFAFAQPILSASPTEVGAAYKDRPDVIHFSGHGDDRRLMFIRDNGALADEEPLDAAQLVVILSKFRPQPALCFLNACQSASIAEELAKQGVAASSIGWADKVPDGIAAAFASAFYEHIARGQSVQSAFSLSVATCGDKGIALESRIFGASGIDLEHFFI